MAAKVYTTESSVSVDYTGDGSRLATIHRSGRTIIAGYGAGLLDRVFKDVTYPSSNTAIGVVLRDLNRVGVHLNDEQITELFRF